MPCAPAPSRSTARRSRAVAGWARELGVAILAGSIPEAVDGDDHLFNTSALIGADGELVAAYRKIHLFDVDVGGVAYRESDTERPGEEIVVADGRLADESVEVGLTVCYDLRFPELYRILAVRGARASSPSPRRSPRSPARPTGRSCCAPGRSRTRPS